MQASYRDRNHRRCALTTLAPFLEIGTVPTGVFPTALPAFPFAFDRAGKRGLRIVTLNFHLFASILLRVGHRLVTVVPVRHFQNCVTAAHFHANGTDAVFGDGHQVQIQRVSHFARLSTAADAQRLRKC